MPRTADGGGGLVIRQASGSLKGNAFKLSYVVEEVNYEGVIFEGRVNADGSLFGRGPNDLNDRKAWTAWHGRAKRRAACMPDLVEMPQTGTGAMQEAPAGGFPPLKTPKNVHDVMKR
jgi:hypothetical protein